MLVDMYMLVRVHVCGARRHTWVPFPQYATALFLRQGLPFTLFAHSQQASGIYLSLPQALGLQVHATMLCYFVWALGTKIRSM